jgi:hypothetical protein
MIEIALRRWFSKFVASPKEVRREQGKTDRGWQGKRPAVGPAYVVGRVRGFGHSGKVTAGALHIFSKEIKAASAIAPLHKAVLRHDNAGR